MSTVLALDVSKGKSYYVIYSGNNCLYEGEIFHTKEGVENLLAKICILDEIPEVVFEATGVYSCPVEAFCQRNLLTYYVLNPFHAKNQMEKETLRKWKTDKFDAHRLSQTHGNNKRSKKIPSESIFKELRDLSRFYQKISDEIVRMKVKLHNALQMTFPELELLLNNRITHYGLVLIRLYPHPNLVLDKSKTIIKNHLLKYTDKRISDKYAKNKAERIIAYAKNSYPSVSENDIHVQKNSILCGTPTIIT